VRNFELSLKKTSSREAKRGNFNFRLGVRGNQLNMFHPSIEPEKRYPARVGMIKSEEEKYRPIVLLLSVDSNIMP